MNKNKGDDHFERWLMRYGEAWEGKNVQAFSSLFSKDADYYWTPFEKPKCGPDEIGRAFQAAVESQTEISFAARVIDAGPKNGLAHWTCSFTRINTGANVRIDGILAVEFDDNDDDKDRAICFREWWHRDEQ